MEKKPGLALLITSALAKKGKAKHNPMADEMPEDMSDESALDYHEHLKSIAEDILKAVEAKDAEALANFLHEAFECCDMMPHEEGPHNEEE